jgi:anti-sigma B factor antagonist
MTINVRRKGDISILEFSGEMRIGAGDLELKRTLHGRLEAGDRLFVFDMLKVPWIDSAGVGEIVAGHKRVIDRRGAIKLVLKGKALDVFTVTALCKVFDIYSDVEEALASFAGR